MDSPMLNKTSLLESLLNSTGVSGNPRRFATSSARPRSISGAKSLMEFADIGLIEGGGGF
jgi:LPS sulfotransferase NodH